MRSGYWLFCMKVQEVGRLWQAQQGSQLGLMASCFVERKVLGQSVHLPEFFWSCLLPVALPMIQQYD